jgi:large subunit ribosomal protein L17
MRHKRLRGKLGVKTAHRKALLRNMVRNLVIHRSIRTTVAKAKVTSAFADGMVELAKRGDLHARRLLIARLGCAMTANTLITQIAPHFKDRKGGYTRVLRLTHRPGDGGEMAILQFTAAVEAPDKPAKPKKEKKAKVQEVKKEDKPKKATKPSKSEEAESKAEEKKKDIADKKESEKKGGFLGKLRRFLKGEEEQH